MKCKVRSVESESRRSIAAVSAAVVAVSSLEVALGSDHLDTPTVSMNPRGDIGDLYAWTSPEGRQLNLVMTIVGRSFSEKIEYAFHVDSGQRFGSTTATTSIVCRFTSANAIDCRVGDADRARGDANSADGLGGRNGRFRVFAGERDDPFFNNVKGTRAAYQTASKALRSGAAVDAAGCPRFDHATVEAIRSEWRSTDGGAATNFLAGWTPASLVVSIDLDVVAKDGRMLAVWATTSSEYGQLDRVGRPLTGNALLATLGPQDVSDRLKEQYNRATPATSARFAPEIEKSLGLYDGLDGKCGNQLLANKEAPATARYHALAALLADDRLWVNGASSVCTQLLAVERAHLAGQSALSDDCGGRALSYSAANVYRSLLADGTIVSVDDGVNRDEREHSGTVFPFLAAPNLESVSKQ
jgi:hypothetical protein